MSQDQFERRALALLDEALARPEGEQVAYVAAATGDDSALRARVLSLLTLDSEGGSVLRTGGAGRDSEELDAPERVGAYRVTGLIGQGGMGAVFSAERDAGDFEHRVAIKIVRPGVLSDALIERFRRERQILADLSHPNIARLFDGGELPSGAPYMIMELVDGEPIMSWAEARGLGLDARLELFLDACAAVRHAHQNLIVHRDITPTNVLVTVAGQVKLIDFGIARPHDARDGASPVSGPSLASLSFTPGFAAPERARGGPTNTLSDIYSLGKLLDALTQGVADRGPELGAIIARAAALEAETRYPSVDALMEDIGRLRAGYSVDAYGEGAGYRFGKFLSRRRLPVAIGLTAFAALAGALVVSLNLYREAELARLDANARFSQVRAIASTMMFDIYDEIDLVPGTVEAKRKLAEAAQTYLDLLAGDAARGGNDLIYDMARGRIRLAEIVGTPGFSSFAEFGTAGAHLDAAAGLLERLRAVRPDDPDILRLAADLAFERANHQLYVHSNPAGALAALDEADALARRALALRPDDWSTGLLLQTMQANRATILFRDAQTQAALESIETNIAALTEMVDAMPDAFERDRKVDLLSNLGRSLRLKAEILLGQGTNDAVGAEAAADRALGILAQLDSLGEGAKQSHLRALEFTYWRRAYARFNQSRFTAAAEDYDMAIGIASERARRDPADSDARRSLATYHGESAATLIQLGRFEAAEQNLLRATDWFQARYDLEPGVGTHQRAIMVQHVQLHEFYKSRGAARETERCFHLERIKRYWDEQVGSGTLLESDRPSLEAYFADNPLADCAPR